MRLLFTLTLFSVHLPNGTQHKIIRRPNRLTSHGYQGSVWPPVIEAMHVLVPFFACNMYYVVHTIIVTKCWCSLRVCSIISL